MANEEHVEIVNKGAKAIESWRRENRGDRLDLRGADLRLDLREAKLSIADLHGASLNDTDLGGTNLFKANLCGADLHRVTGLSQEQVSWALGDTNTKLPDGLVRPAHWKVVEPVEKTE